MRTTGRIDAARLLGVGTFASPDEIAAAFRARLQICHPDRYTGAPAAVQRAATELTALLNDARDTLLAATPDPYAAPPAPDPAVRTPRPLDVRPGRIRAEDVTPGTSVEAVLTLTAGEPLDGEIAAYSLVPGMRVGLEPAGGSGRTRRVVLRIDTGLLAESRVYDFFVLVACGTCVGRVDVHLTTAGLEEWRDIDPPAPVGSARRIRLLTRWIAGGPLVAAVALTWARGRIPLLPVAYPAWVTVAALIWLAVSLAVLAGSRAHARRPHPWLRPAAAAIDAVGAAVIACLRGLGRRVAGRRR